MSLVKAASSAAVLFGINYVATPDARLNGCVNDVKNVASFLASIGMRSVDVCTDEDPSTAAFTTGEGIGQKLAALAERSFVENLDFVWVHFSCHGTSIPDVLILDEKDGKDECIVPSDFKTGGVVPDDMLAVAFSRFNPKTRIVAVFDCCHSGTVCDPLFKWDPSTLRKAVENPNCPIPGKMITISGCLDAQVSADMYNIMGDDKYSGALTSCLMTLLRTQPRLRSDVFKLVAALRDRIAGTLGLKDQVPLLCTTFDITSDKALLPARLK